MSGAGLQRTLCVNAESLFALIAERDRLEAENARQRAALRIPRVRQALHATEARGTMAVTGGVTRSAEAQIARAALEATGYEA